MTKWTERRGRSPLAAVLALVVAACGGGPGASEPEHPTFWSASGRPVCLALSVGGVGGLAHLGAIEAIRERGLDVRCVVGNSMGALVGSLYASAPAEPLPARYRAYVAAYVAQSQREAGGRGLLGALFGVGLAMLAGGSPLLLGSAGASAALASTPELDHERTVRVLDDFLGRVRFEQLPIRFAAYYVDLQARGVDTRSASRGNVAQAVGRSIANPLLFPGFDAKEAGYVDPGVDRLARTPIQDTCSLFPESRILAINVTGKPSFFTADLPCPVLEVKVPLEVVEDDAMRGEGQAFEAVVRAGHDAAAKALATSR